MASTTRITFKCTCSGACRDIPLYIIKPDLGSDTELDCDSETDYEFEVDCESESVSNSEVDSKLLDKLQPDLPLNKNVKSIRFWVGELQPIAAYVLIELDQHHFHNRLFITHSDLFVYGKENHLYQRALNEPGLIIKDLAKFEGCGPLSFFEFISGRTLLLKNNIEKKILSMLVAEFVQNLDEKKYNIASDSIKAIFAIFDSNFTIADVPCRYIKPTNCEFNTIEERFYHITDKKTLRYTFNPGRSYSLFWNGHSEPMYKTLDSDDMKGLTASFEDGGSTYVLRFIGSEGMYPSHVESVPATCIPYLPTVPPSSCHNGESRLFEEQINKRGMISDTSKQYLAGHMIQKKYRDFPLIEEPEIEHYNAIEFFRNYKEHKIYRKAESEIPTAVRVWYQRQPCRHVLLD